MNNSQDAVLLIINNQSQLKYQHHLPTFDYLNFDTAEDRLLLQEKTWDRTKDLLIFDELHKMMAWKRWLKGIYDTEVIQIPIIVTGSAQMDMYRKMGDSLAGCFLSHRLHPLDMQEAHSALKM